MKQQVYVVMDFDEPDPEDVVWAVLTDRHEAELLVAENPTNNLVVRKFPVYNTCRDVEL